ncbi:substrate-binding periplasmic protein [Alteromonas sp. CYL-A6]|uniref:substrate-binding periplasmic protein n=1 Tax=Alteromonas nitratireducens TaxID=3390813 RepID=UPI0034C1E709
MEVTKRVRQRLIFFCLFCVGLAQIALSWSVRADEPLTIVVTPQLSGKDDDNQPGFEASIAAGVVKEAGLPVYIEEVPSARQLLMLEKGEKILASALVRTPEREQQYYWITPMSSNPITLFAKNSHPIARKPSPSFSDVETVSAIRGGYRESVLTELGKTVMGVTSWRQAVEAVLHDRVDAVFFSRTGLSVVCKENKLDCSALTPVLTWGETTTYLVMPRKPEYAALAEQLTAAADRFKQTETYRNALDKTIEKLARYGVSAVREQGVLRFVSPTDLLAQDLWVLADQVPFFSEQASDGTVTGYAAELVKAILNEAGIEKPILSTPWERIVRESSKPNLLAFSVARTPERESLYYWITPITRNMHALYGINGQRYVSLNAVPREARIGVLAGDYREAVAKEAGFDVTAFDSWEAATLAMLNGEIDYVFGSRGGVTTACRSLIADCSDVMLVAEYRIISLYLVLSRNGTEPLLAKVLQDAADRVKHSAAFAQWSASWSEKLWRANGLTHHIKDGVIQLWRENE